MKTLLAIVSGMVAAACINLCGGAVVRADTLGTFLVKPGVTSDQWWSDRQGCWDLSYRTAGRGVSINLLIIQGAKAIFLPTGIFTSIVENESARDQFIHNCMVLRGYTEMKLDLMDLRAYRAAKEAGDLKPWMTGFLAEDHTARIAEANAWRAEAWPEAARTPYTYRQLRLDPGSLRLATDTAKDGDILIEGALQHRASAKLRSDFNGGIGPLDITVALPAGMVFAQGVMITPDTPYQSMWCAVGKVGVSITRSQQLCLWTDRDGYKLVGAVTPVPWLSFPMGKAAGFHAVTNHRPSSWTSAQTT